MKTINKYNVISLLFCLYFFWQMMYCSVQAFWSNDEEFEASFYYAFGVVLFGALSTYRTLFDGISIFTKNFFITVFLPLFFICSYLFENNYYVPSEESDKYFNYYIVFGIPASYIGVFCARYDITTYFVKWLDIIMLIVSVGLLYSIPAIVMNSSVSLGLASYQQMAYMAGFAFDLNLAGILLDEKLDRFAFMRRGFIRYLCMFLLIFQLIACLFSGGRGGFIYLCASSIFLLFYSRKVKNGLYVVIFFLLLIGVFSMLKGTNIYYSLESRMERTFSFLSNVGGIDLQNREIVWVAAEKQIIDNGFLGCGIFNYYHVMRVNFDQPYAHNIFYDFFIQRGVLYFIFWIAIFIKLFFNVVLSIIHKSNIVPLMFFVYALCLLMFSTTYLQSSMFWFAISYFYTYKFKSAVKVNEVE